MGSNQNVFDRNLALPEVHDANVALGWKVLATVHTLNKGPENRVSLDTIMGEWRFEQSVEGLYRKSWDKYTGEKAADSIRVLVSAGLLESKVEHLTINDQMPVVSYAVAKNIRDNVDTIAKNIKNDASITKESIEAMRLIRDVAAINIGTLGMECTNFANKVKQDEFMRHAKGNKGSKTAVT